MSAALALPTFLPGRLFDQGMEVPADLTYEQWEDALHRAEWLERASPWFVVDLVAWGKARFGESYSQAFPDAFEDPGGARRAKLIQADWMADRWPASTRVKTASYTHHRIVAKLDRSEAVALLQQATRTEDEHQQPVEPWSTRRLAEEVKARERAIEADITESICAADRQPTRRLNEEARQALARCAAETRVLPELAERVFTWTLGWLDCRDAEECFDVS